MKQTTNVNITSITPIISPRELKDKCPISDVHSDFIYTARDHVKRILHKQDPRLLLVVGPCSIHDPTAAIEYAKRLSDYHAKYSDRLYIMMRVYFEKPRTTIGWKGLINDPDLDNSRNMSKGLEIARRLMIQITELGLPIGTEMLDPIVPQYISDLVSWGAIGARTTESQTHREMVSGLSMPIGFKNSTDGNIQVACDAIKSAEHPHRFLGINQDGKPCLFSTSGNPNCHIILRGGNDGPNYDSVAVSNTLDKMDQLGVNTGIMIDCSHGNSSKKCHNQPGVWDNVIAQRVKGNTSLIGLMLESNLSEGNQALKLPLSNLKYGVSVTDECLGWDDTARLLESAYSALS